MAILFTIFTNLQHLVSKYVLTDQLSSLFGGTFSMPVVYIFILGVIALVAYFCWQSYRQDVHEEKLQKNTAKEDEAHSSYNLAWVNKLVNWVYMTSPHGLPEAIQRWMEDVNLNLAKSEHPIKILLYAVREKSMPPWIGNIGQLSKRENHVELPVFLHFEKDDLAFTVSVQEENEGKVIASTYNVIVTQFQCWFTLYISMVDGKGFLAKLAAQPQSLSQVQFRLDLLSDQKISTTVPEVVIDIVKKGLLETPIYLNVSNWGSVIPTSKSKASVKREGNSSPPAKDRSPENGKSEVVRRRHKDKKKQTLAVEDDSIPKSNTMPSGSTSIVSERLKLEDTQGLSGSLGSLVGIKRTPSGRGPAKPIRSREKRMIMKVVETTGLLKEGSVFCRAILDRPRQKCQTRFTRPGSAPAWLDDELTFDLSSRSSEVKLVFYRADETRNNEGSAIASSILYLEQIDTDKSSQHILQLRTANKESAQVMVQLDFTENPVDPTSQKFSSPRRSLDLSYISDQVQEKEKATRLVSTPSSYSTENMSSMNKSESPVTIVKTVTTKKLTKNTTITSTIGTSNMKRAAVESDTATVQGTVVETAVKDLSEQSELAKQSPDTSMKIRKGKVIITAIAKTNLDENLAEDVVVASENLVGEAVQRIGSFHSVAESEARSCSEATTDANDEASFDGNGVQERNTIQGHGDRSKGRSKTRRSRSERPKSLATGIKASDLPQKQNEDREWPKVRRSRSLIFGRGKKKIHKTGSATDLEKQSNSKEDNGLDDDSMLTVPENDLQKQKKKKSKSISKLISKLGRRPSQRKSKTQSDPVAEESISGTFPSPASYSGSPYQATPASSGRPPSIAGSESSTPSSLQPSLTDSSFQNSLTPDGSGLKRSKSLRKRLFGGKRKTNKN